MAYLLYEESERIGIATFHRPEARNALSAEAIEECIGFFQDLGDRIERGGRPRALVLTGAGGGFIAGADLKEMASMDRERACKFSQRGNALMNLVETLAVPVIAAVNGYALGGGLEMALAADFIYASAGAKLGMPELSLGLMPGFGGIRRLCLRLGPSKAKALVYTSRTVSAEEALSMGLIDGMTPPEDLTGRCLGLARETFGAGLLAFRAAKRQAMACLLLDAEASAVLEAERFGTLFDGAEPAEGMAAFLAKRKSAWAAGEEWR